MDEELPKNIRGRKNPGYATILKIYHELSLDDFFKNRERNKGFKYNANSIMALLVISRLLSPGSKKKAFEEKDRHVQRFVFSFADIYCSLSHHGSLEIELQEYLNEKINDKYKRDTGTIQYDVTNFYFETDKATAQRNKLIKSVMGLMQSPVKHDRATSYGAAKHVKDTAFDKDTGQIANGKKTSFDYEKLGK